LNKISFFLQHVNNKHEHATKDYLHLRHKSQQIERALKEETFNFIPRLPEEKLKVFKSNHSKMGIMNIVYFLFDKVYWPSDKNFFGIAYSNGAQNHIWTTFLNLSNIRSDKEPILMAQVVGKKAILIETMSTNEIIDSVMPIFREMFGSTIPEPIMIEHSSWFSNPFIKGAWVYTSLDETGGGGNEDFEVLSQEVENKIFFAGEGTTIGRNSIDGASLSGIREAKKILKLLE